MYCYTKACEFIQVKSFTLHPQVNKNVPVCQGQPRFGWHWIFCFFLIRDFLSNVKVEARLKYVQQITTKIKANLVCNILAVIDPALILLGLFSGRFYIVLPPLLIQFYFFFGPWHYSIYPSEVQVHKKRKNYWDDLRMLNRFHNDDLAVGDLKKKRFQLHVLYVMWCRCRLSPFIIFLDSLI